MKVYEKYISEASEVTPGTSEWGRDKEAKDLLKLTTDLVGKGNVKDQSFFSGIHGEIVSFNSIYGNRIRVSPKDLKKIMSNKNVRWIDISSIGS